MPNAGTKRAKLPPEVEASVLIKSARRCAICFAYAQDFKQKPGQIAHLDHNRDNSAEDNLMFLCIQHHSEYDSVTRQHKNYTKTELKKLRKALYQATNALAGASQVRINWTVELSGSYDDFDTPGKKREIETNLRSLLRDETLVVERIRRGSIIVDVESTLGAFWVATEGLESLTVDHSALIRLVYKMYRSVLVDLNDAGKTAVVVESALRESGLLRPLGDVSSQRWSAAEMTAAQLVEESKLSIEKVKENPPMLRLAAIMAMLHMPADRFASIVGTDVKTAEIYLVLGQLLSREGEASVSARS